LVKKVVVKLYIGDMEYMAGYNMLMNVGYKLIKKLVARDPWSFSI